MWRWEETRRVFIGARTPRSRLKTRRADRDRILKELRACYNEVFNGFSLTKFDRTTIMTV
jgi:hypothetical protein